MIATILAGLFAIACGIAANLLTPTIRRALALEAPPSQPLPRREEPEPESPADIELLRAQNRRRLNEFLAQCYFYGVSYYALFAALYLPLKFKALGSDSVLDLSRTRISVDLAIQSEHFVALALIGAFVLYIPCWSVAVRGATLVGRIWHNYQEVNAIRFGAFITLAMLLFAFLICGHWIFLLRPQNSYLGSVLMPFMAMVFVAGLASSRR